MAEEDHSYSESDENSEESSSDEQESVNNGGRGAALSNYEKQRLERIRENKARLEALRLPTLASSLLGSIEKKEKVRKGKHKKVGDDEDYKPSEDEEKTHFSSEVEEEEEEFQECSGSASARKGKRKQSVNTVKSKKKRVVQNPIRKLDFTNDDEALQQAIALSLGGSSEISHAAAIESSQNCREDVADTEVQERKGRATTQKTDKRKEKRKSNKSRVQITEDQVIIHFFQFDEAGKGGITARDLKRVAEDHDFTWTDKEMEDMIHLFTNNGTGRLNFDDFRKILQRCDMIKEG